MTMTYLNLIIECVFLIPAAFPVGIVISALVFGDVVL